MTRVVLAVVAFAKHASDGLLGWPELDKSETPFRNSSREISRSHPTITHANNLPVTMVFPDSYPSPLEPDTFSLPVAPEEVAQWAQVSGDVQPELVDAINFDFESLDALFTWEQGGTLPKPTPELGGSLVSICTISPRKNSLTSV